MKIILSDIPHLKKISKNSELYGIKNEMAPRAVPIILNKINELLRYGGNLSLLIPLCFL